ncbi:hypothetical protein GUJ93_ZPchr0011g27861 [Zizania palustris]|uniref:Uncharacterized protein n=1 Tax=Zizania palustris TaxID=103762 RepID=A0A8J5WLT7_ZIZPA|nr:hypothetical protein GUJ93_ZPchr0011g27861 [Zizania palustris]
MMEAMLQTVREGSSSSVRSLTMDDAVKCLHGAAADGGDTGAVPEHRAPVDRWHGVVLLTGFPRMRWTRPCLITAGLGSLHDFHLSNNRWEERIGAGNGELRQTVGGRNFR